MTAIDTVGMRRSAVTYLTLALSLTALTMMTVAAHEGAHLACAIILNIPVLSVEWLNLHTLAPAVVSGPAENLFAVTMVSYAGGLTAGALLLATLVVGKHWFRLSLQHWLLGCWMACLASWQIFQGVAEGAFHHAYVTETVTVFGPVSSAGVAFSLLWALLYGTYLCRPPQSELQQSR